MVDFKLDCREHIEVSEIETPVSTLLRQQTSQPGTMAVMIRLEAGLVRGADTGLSVWDKYKPPFMFTGSL